MKTPPPSSDTECIERGLLVVREGPSANCSSIGSVVDTLFVTAVVGGALFVAVAAALQRERGDVRVVGGATASTDEPDPKKEEDDAPPT